MEGPEHEQGAQAGHAADPSGQGAGERPETFQELLNPNAVQAICAELTPEDRARARLACRKLHRGRREADALAGGKAAALSAPPVFRSALLAAWFEAH